MRKPKPQGRGIVKALGQKGTTGNFARIAASKGKGAAIAALQNKLAKHRGQPIPFHRKHKNNAAFLNALKSKEAQLEKTPKKTPKEFALEKLISKVGKKPYIGKRKHKLDFNIGKAMRGIGGAAMKGAMLATPFSAVAINDMVRGAKTRGFHKHKATAQTPTNTADRIHHKKKPTKKTGKGLPPGLARYLANKRANNILQSGPKKPMPMPMMPGAPMMKQKKYDFKKAEKKLGMVS